MNTLVAESRPEAFEIIETVDQSFLRKQVARMELKDVRRKVATQRLQTAHNRALRRLRAAHNRELILKEALENIANLSCVAPRETARWILEGLYPKRVRREA